MGVWAYGGVWRWEGEGEGTYLSFEAVEHGSLDLGVGAELFRLARDAKSLGHLGELIRLGGMGWGRMGLYGEGRSGTERDGAGRSGEGWDGMGRGGLGWNGDGMGRCGRTRYGATLHWATQTARSIESSPNEQTPPASTLTNGDELYVVFIFSRAMYSPPYAQKAGGGSSH